MGDQTVAEVAELYLGNILYAIELAAVSLDGQGRQDDAAFYRAIARRLAEAHGRSRGAGPDVRDAGEASESGAPRGAY